MGFLLKTRRILKHAFAWRPNYVAAFTPQCLSAITQAVQASEALHSAQICVIAEHTVPFSYLRRNAPVRQRADMLFGKHRVWDTEGNTGVLIYINFVERAVELVADRALTRGIAQSQWNAWAAQLQTAYAQGQFEAGTVAVVQSMGRAFAIAAPRDGQLANENTQPDAPIVL